MTTTLSSYRTGCGSSRSSCRMTAARRSVFGSKRPRSAASRRSAIGYLADCGCWSPASPRAWPGSTLIGLEFNHDVDDAEVIPPARVSDRAEPGRLAGISRTRRPPSCSRPFSTRSHAGRPAARGAAAPERTVQSARAGARGSPRAASKPPAARHRSMSPGSRSPHPASCSAPVAGEDAASASPPGHRPLARVRKQPAQKSGMPGPSGLLRLDRSLTRRASPRRSAIVAHYFASDVHLRFDRPDRDRRFSHWLAA